MYEKLNFSWDEVHEVAEQLEHIQSEKLINKLDAFLEFPDFDPHGDPIPNADGEIKKMQKRILFDIQLNDMVKCVGVKDSSVEFLQFLDKKGISLGTNITILEKENFEYLSDLIENANGIKRILK